MSKHMNLKVACNTFNCFKAGWELLMGFKYHLCHESIRQKF